jgi:hypothetical protein
VKDNAHSFWEDVASTPQIVLKDVANCSVENGTRIAPQSDVTETKSSPQD